MMLALFLLHALFMGCNAFWPFDHHRPVYPDTYNGPVIGILTQGTHGTMERYGHSYIAASYIKYAQMAGAQVIPIFDSWSSEELNSTLHSINGVIIPGGGQYFPDSTFYRASKYIYDWTININKNGTYFPLWGTCLGFEAILYAEANNGASLKRDIRFNCSAHMANNLTIEEGAQNSRMLQHLDSKLYEAVQTELLVFNSHNFCISPEMIRSPTGPLNNNYHLLGVNWDAHGQQYIALVEHKKLPIYGSQFHPEKNGFEWTPYLSIPHSRNAILLMQYFANFLVQEARQNKQQFPEASEFYKRTINNYNPVNTLQAFNSSLESCYFFHDKRNHRSDEINLTE